MIPDFDSTTYYHMIPDFDSTTYGIPVELCGKKVYVTVLSDRGNTLAINYRYEPNESMVGYILTMNTSGVVQGDAPVDGVDII
jgi:hypothetical protein